MHVVSANYTRKGRAPHSRVPLTYASSMFCTPNVSTALISIFSSSPPFCPPCVSASMGSEKNSRLSSSFVGSLKLRRCVEMVDMVVEACRSGSERVDYLQGQNCNRIRQCRCTELNVVGAIRVNNDEAFKEVYRRQGRTIDLCTCNPGGVSKVRWRCSLRCEMPLHTGAA